MASSRDEASDKSCAVGSIFPVLTYKNDGHKDATTAAIVLVDLAAAPSLEEVAAAMARKVYGGAGAASGALLYTLDGVPVDDVRVIHACAASWRDADLSRGGLRLVVALAGEPPLQSPPAAPPEAAAASEAADGAAETGPREVTVSFYMNNLKKVDAIEGVVEVDFQLYLQWVDPALAGFSVEQRPPYARPDGEEGAVCWNPKVEVNNNVSLETLWEVFPEAYQGVEEGRVVWGARYRGGVSNDMDLSMFPLDSDFFAIKVGPKELTTERCVLRIDPKKHGRPEEGLPGDSIKASSLTEWNHDIPVARVGRSGPTGSGNYYSNAEFGVMLHRNFMYYVYKVLIILTLLVFSSWSVFAQDALDFADRVNTALTLFLAAVAFLYVVGESLPKISYLTLLDKCMLTAFAFVFLSGLESFIVFVIASRGSPSEAADVDGWCSILVPVAYCIANASMFWKGFRYRWKVMGDKNSEEYRREVAMESTIKDAESAASERQEGTGERGAVQGQEVRASSSDATCASTNPLYRGTSSSNASAGTLRSLADSAASGIELIARKRSSIKDKLMGVSDDKKAQLEHEREEQRRRRQQ